jgi:hypothetical protein
MSPEEVLALDPEMVEALVRALEDPGAEAADFDLGEG